MLKHLRQSTLLRCFVFLVVATWLLTTLSACVPSDIALLRGPTQLKEKIVETPSNKCPDKLWGVWGASSNYESFSHNIDESGVESVTIGNGVWAFGFGNDFSATLVVDNKKHPAGGGYYRARCDLQIEKSGPRVFRIMSFDKQGSLTRMVDRFIGRNGLLYFQAYNDRLEKARDMAVQDRVE